MNILDKTINWFAELIQEVSERELEKLRETTCQDDNHVFPKIYLSYGRSVMVDKTKKCQCEKYKNFNAYTIDSHSAIIKRMKEKNTI